MSDNKPPTVVFKSTVPSSMDTWKENDDLDVQWFNKRLPELADKLGHAELMIRQSWWGFHVDGFRCTDEGFTAPEGWREYGKGEPGIYIPKMRTTAGKKVSALLESYGLNFRDLPGLPRLILGEGAMGTWVMEKFGDDWFASLTLDLGSPDEELSRLSEVDTNLWDRVPLSTYHLAKEAHHD